MHACVCCNTGRALRNLADPASTWAETQACSPIGVQQHVHQPSQGPVVASKRMRDARVDCSQGADRQERDASQRRGCRYVLEQCNPRTLHSNPKRHPTAGLGNLQRQGLPCNPAQQSTPQHNPPSGSAAMDLAKGSSEGSRWFSISMFCMACGTRADGGTQQRSRSPLQRGARLASP